MLKPVRSRLHHQHLAALPHGAPLPRRSPAAYGAESAWYDRIYAWKDYAQESARITELLTSHGVPAGGHLLDVGCGTGRHLVHLAERFEAEGLDQSAAMLAIARQRLPTTPLHAHDLTTPLPFGSASFDAVISMFGVVGYIGPLRRLRSTIRELARVLRPGGVVLIEPWLTPERAIDGRVILQHADGQELKLVRMSRLEIQGKRSILHFHWLAGHDGQPISHRVERHVLTLYTEAEVEAAIAAAGLRPIRLAAGLMTDRGLWLGVKEPR